MEITVTTPEATEITVEVGTPSAANVAALINGATAKTTPADADRFALTDSAASYALKKSTWANIKATLKTYFDTLYEATGAAAAVLSTSAQKSANLSDLASASTARTNLGLGTAATTDATAYATAAQGALADTSVQTSGDQTIGGIKSFSSTTRPTSAGTGTPAATSLITLDDADERARTATRMVLREEFVGGTTSDGTIGELGWSKYGTGTGNIAAPNDSGSANPGVMRITSGNASGDGSTLYLYKKFNPLGGTNWHETWVFALGQTTDCDLILGGTKDNGSIGIGVFGGQSYGLRYSSAHDTDFMFYAKNTNSDFAANDASNYAITSGVAVDSGVFHKFEMRSTSLGVVEMRIDGGSWVTVSIVSLSAGYNTFAYIATRTAANKYADIDFFSRTQTLSR